MFSGVLRQAGFLGSRQKRKGAVAQPGITHVADHILGESGFRSRSDEQADEAERGQQMEAATAAQTQQPQQPAQGVTDGAQVQ